jgi:hypothetical protein
MGKSNYNFKKLHPFKWFILQNYPFLEDSIDVLTNYQLFCKLGEEINKNRDSINEIGENETEVVTAFNNLYDYVHDYFENLDVQEEINNKLDEMADDGTLYQIIRTYTDPIIAEQNDHIEEITDNQDIKINANTADILTNTGSINTLSNQIASIITHNQDTSSNTELIDIRTEFDGTVAASAGNAVRAQATALNTRINNSDSNIAENVIKNYYGLDGYKNQSFQNGAGDNGSHTGMAIPSGSSGFSSFICYFLNFRDNSRLERYTGKTIKFTIKYQYNGDDLYANLQSTQLKLRSWDGLTTYTTVDGDQSHVTSSITGNVITKSISWTIASDTKYLGVLLQLMANQAVDEDTTLTVLENTYELIDTSMTKNTNALTQFLRDRNTETNLTIKADGTGDFYRIKDCFDFINSQGDNNANNIYNVYIYSGVYDVLSEQGGTTWLNNISIANGERQGLTIPNFVRLIGKGNVIVQCKIPGTITNNDAYRCVSLFNCKQWNEIYNIKMVSQNVRYTVHDEASNSFGKAHRLWRNCTFERVTGRTDIFSTTNYGGGLGSGGDYTFENCIFLNDGTNLFIHNNNSIEPCFIVVDGCYLKSNSYGHSINFGYTGSNTYNSIATIKNCMYNDVANIEIESGSDNAWSIYNYVDNTVTISGENQ